MDDLFSDESILEAYLFEASQLIEGLEQVMISSEKSGFFDTESINEIFRCMHTIKGSSAMMMYDNISNLTHQLEDIFYVIRENANVEYDFTTLVDIMLESLDYLKIELMKIRAGENSDGDGGSLYEKLSGFLKHVKEIEKGVEKEVEDLSAEIRKKEKEEVEQEVQTPIENNDSRYYRAGLWFQEDAEMKNIRAYAVARNLSDLVEEMLYLPKDIEENLRSVEEIQNDGFRIVCRTGIEGNRIREQLENTAFLERLEFEEICETDFIRFGNGNASFETGQESESQRNPQDAEKQDAVADTVMNTKQSIISVNVNKLDNLMDVVGEIVIAEAMVTQNPEVNALEIESFSKASRQLHKITAELQDLVMAIRMVPLSTTFMKMHRIVRDMTKKLGKDIALDVFGEETEVDKNIIEKIADPLMHIIRNAIDHGIESAEERSKDGKNSQGNIVLEASNSGSDVIIVVKDDGRGLDKRALYEKAERLGLTTRSYEEMADRDLYSLILHPGFSTKEEITEYSGRGVGMDVVVKNIESIGGAVLVDSVPGNGTTITMKIPLTLAIIEGMNLRVGNERFTIPIVAIKESFRPSSSEIITDPEGQEMIMVRGHCYPILRLHEFYKVPTQVESFNEGILIMIKKNEGGCCIFADELLGNQQVVIKALPNYLNKFKQRKGIGGCTLLGDGNISLILDVGELMSFNHNDWV